MDQLIEKWSTDPKLAFEIAVFSLLFGLIGVLGVVFTVLSSFAQKRKEIAFEEILKAAQRENQFNKTEEDIQKNEQYVKNLKGQITKDIPLYARVSVLKAKAEKIHKELETEYKEYIEIKSELTELGHQINNDVLDERLMEVINPYSIKLNQKSMLVIISLIVIIAPILFDYLYYSLYMILMHTGAHISREGAIAYICALIFTTILIFPHFEKRTRLVTKKKLLPISIVLIAGSFLIFYFPLYDIVTEMSIQVVLTVLSIILFAVGMDGIVQVFQKMHI